MIDRAAASQLATELMLVSALVAGQDAEAAAESLREAGVAADTPATRAPGGYDLLLLLSTGRFAADVAALDAGALLDSAAAVSERVLLVLPEAPAQQDTPAVWFEYFAERDYQPVVDFTADFLGRPAFLVDRAATAGEEELAAFAARLQGGAAAAAQPGEGPGGQQAMLRAMTAELEAQRAQIAEQAALIAALEAAARSAEAQRGEDADSFAEQRLAEQGLPGQALAGEAMAAEGQAMPPLAVAGAAGFFDDATASVDAGAAPRAFSGAPGTDGAGHDSGGWAGGDFSPEAQGGPAHRADAEADPWEGLRGWINAVVRDPSRNEAALLERDLARLNALRGSQAPALERPGPAAKPPGLLARLLRRRHAPAAAGARLLEDAALVRASLYFDPAWYVASAPELSAGETVDPVLHYLAVGALRGADPGPYFDSAAYLAAHPDAASSGQAPLVHAIRTGAAEISGQS